MNKQITHISVLQTSKVVALLYGFISLIYAFVGVFMLILGSGKMRIMGIIYIAMPVIMLILGFFTMLLCCWMYNVIAKLVGGIEFTIEDK